jgi:hypothetical protein
VRSPLEWTINRRHLRSAVHAGKAGRAYQQ